MSNPEMQQESPEDLADRIAEMKYAMNVDAGLEGPQKAKATRTIDQLDKDLASKTSNDEAAEMIKAADERLKEEDKEDWDRLKAA